MSFKSKIFVVLYFMTVMWGSAFYFISTVIKPFFILYAPLIFISLLHIRFLRRVHILPALVILIFVLFTIPYTITGYDQLRILDNLYILLIIPTIILSAFVNYNTVALSYFTKVGVWFLLFTSVIVLFELFTGFRFVEHGNSYMISGQFNNSNDLATITVCLSLMLYYLSDIGVHKISKLVIICITFIILLITLSRTALFSFAILLVLYSTIRNHKALIPVFIVLICAYIYYLTGLESLLLMLRDHDNATFSENAERLWVFLYAFSDDRSVEVRGEVYRFFIDNTSWLNIGYGIKNYEAYFRGSSVMDLAYINPHSLLIELSLSFGIIGFLYFIYYPLSTLIYSFRSYKYDRKLSAYLLVIGMYFILGSFIPSSVFRLPVFFLPVSFGIFHYLKQKEEFL